MATEIKTTSSNVRNLKILLESFEINKALVMISPRWKMHILFCISQNIKQFGLLKKALPTLSDQILGKRLKELVTDGLVDKETIKDNNQNQKVYLITTKGSGILEILNQLNSWGESWNSKNKQ
jgi:DNA-binding HxlR family transcriptional regulator